MATANEGTFGSYVSKDIIDQIKVRQEIRAQKAGAWTGDTARLYEAEHENASWVCLRSSVDTPVEEYKPGKKNPTSSDLCKQYVLCGGTLISDEKGTLRFNQETRTGAMGYGYSDTFGYRPRPGITKVTVKTKDTFGCIMEADVEFTVFSLADLEDIDKLYFKPGMSALLEWGHTTWVDNSKTVQRMSSAKLYKMEKFLNSDSFKTVDEKVQEVRKQKIFSGNYEAIFGYITNFNWSFNNVGSYTCKVKILSKGTILEGLQIPSGIDQFFPGSSRKNTGMKADYTGYVSWNQVRHAEPNTGQFLAPTGVLPGSPEYVKVYEEYQVDKAKRTSITRQAEVQRFLGPFDEDAQKSPYHLVLGQIRYKVAEDRVKKSGTIEIPWIDSTETYSYWGENYIHKTPWYKKDDPPVPIAYISLDTFLQITNKILDLANVDFPRFATRQDDDYVEQGFVTFKEHFSLDPYKALVPFRPTTDNNSSIEADSSITDDLRKDYDLQQFLNEIRAFDEQATGLTNNNCIADIMIGANFILDCVNATLGEKADSYRIRDVVDAVLTGVQKAFGNVNNLGVHIDHVQNKASIVDRNCICHDPGEENLLDIVVSGKATTLTNLSVNSEVSAEMANEMSIAATTPDNGLGGVKANSSEVFWNEGCVDRHQPKQSVAKINNHYGETATKPDGTTYKTGRFLVNYTKEEQEARRIEIEQSRGIFYKSRAFLDKAASLYTNFFYKPDAKGEGEFTDGTFETLQNDGETLFRRCVNRDVTGNANGSGGTHFQNGIIPIKLNFTMKGIGRFVVGTTFKVSDGLVPKKYKEWRHLITGVEHNIDSNGWFTTVNSLYYPVVNPAGKNGKGNLRPKKCEFEKPLSGTSGKSFSGTPGWMPGTAQEILIDHSNDVKTIPAPKSAVEKFFREFWKNKKSVPGICAGYVAVMAKSWVSGRIESLPGGLGNAGDTRFAPNSAGRVSVVAENLKRLKWQVLEERYNTNTYGVKLAIARATEPGDIVIYYQLKPNPKNPNYYNHHQHVQMKVPAGLVVQLGKGGTRSSGEIAPGTKKKIDSGWTTSSYNNYGCSFVYSGKSDKDRYLWDVIVLRAPKLNWK